MSGSDLAGNFDNHTMDERRDQCLRMGLNEGGMHAVRADIAISARWRGSGTWEEAGDRVRQLQQPGLPKHNLGGDEGSATPPAARGQSGVSANRAWQRSDGPMREDYDGLVLRSMLADGAVDKAEATYIFERGCRHRRSA